MSRKLRQKSSLREVLGENVRAYRARRRLSQEKLAELSGSHQTYISAIELGTSSASVDVIERIAAALNVPAWRLLRPEDDQEMNKLNR